LYGQSNKIGFPLWLGNHQRVMYLHEGVYVKGSMEWSLDTNMLLHFSQIIQIDLFGMIPAKGNMVVFIIMKPLILSQRKNISV
jgi:hypothetical protein